MTRPGPGTTPSLASEENDEADPDARVDEVIQPELARGHGKLSIERQQEHQIETARADQFRQVGDVHVTERLKNLADNLMGADQQHHFPF